jgi:hypothetical protein
MGGYGSGRWHGHTKKDIVEDCRVLDVNRWTREGILREGVHRFGGWKWCNAATGEETSSIGYEVNTTDMAFPYIRLYYTFTRIQERMDYIIRLQTTQPCFGGLRWWFTCPLLRLGSPCNHRVSKLYLPSGGRYYGCRHCYNLTYESCQQSDKRVIFLRKHPEALMALFDGPLQDVPTSRLLLGLKVLSRSSA